jgi:hypothetical protein
MLAELRDRGAVPALTLANRRLHPRLLQQFRVELAWD